jgi:hypothetical protein
MPEETEEEALSVTPSPFSVEFQIVSVKRHFSVTNVSTLPFCAVFPFYSPIGDSDPLETFSSSSIVCLLLISANLIVRLSARSLRFGSRSRSGREHVKKIALLINSN